MRILRISAGLDPRHGGPAQSTLLSALATRVAGNDIEVATIDEGAACASAIERLRGAGIRVHAFPLSYVPAARRFTISWRLMRWLLMNASRFDVVHVHGAWTASSLAGLVVARARRVPVVLTPHESMTEHDVATSGGAMRLVKRLLRAVYFAMSSAVVYASEIERRDSHPRGRARQAVVPHPIDPPATRSGARKANGTVRVGFLGRFDPKKNLDVLLRALPTHANLVIAGDGPEEQKRLLRQVARVAGVEDRVQWLGFVGGERKADFLGQIDILAMPSRYECFGMVAAEALAAGVPVVVSPSTGIASLVDRYDCGWVVEPSEESLRAVIASYEGLDARAARAVSAVEAELAPEHHAAGLDDVYWAVVEERH